MRHAFLKIFDEINNVEISTEYFFCKITNYYILIKDFPKIYKRLKDNSEIVFIYNLNVVEDYKNCIFHEDEIYIKIRKARTSYYLYDPMSETKLKTSYNIIDLYRIYLQDLYYNSDCEIFLFERKGNKDKLLDVLDSPIYHKNKCINRLIKRYNY